MTKEQARARACVLLDRTDVIAYIGGPVMERYGRYSLSVPLTTTGGIPYSRTVASGDSWQEAIEKLEMHE